MPALLRLAIAAAALAASPAAAEVTLSLYSARQAHLLEPVLEAYTAETGVRFELLTGKPGPLLERLAEGGGDADLLLTVDAGNLWRAAERGLLAPLDSPTLRDAVPAARRDPDDRWFGLSVRARTMVYNPHALRPQELSSYAALADEKWRGRLCLRTSKKVYNQSLAASLIARHGEARAEEIVRGWVANLARDPFASDTKALEAVAAGLCDVTVVNTYYLGRLLRKTPGLPLRPFWADQNGAGVHVNVSGAGVLRRARQPHAAQAFLEWLAGDDAQRLFAELNLEYPVRDDVARDPLVASWGVFRADAWNLSEAGRLQDAAVRLMDRAGYR